MTGTSHRVAIGACVLAVFAGATAVAASPKEEARAAFDKAEIQYKLGRFQEALDAYTRAYEIFPAAPLLFDIGQCHRILGHHERAIFFFEGYLREETNPARRKLAQQLIAGEKAEIENKRATQAALPPPEVASPGVAPPAPPPAASAHLAIAPAPALAERPGAAPSMVDAPVRTDDAQPSGSAGRRWWLWALIGGAVLAASAGALVYYESGAPSTVLPGGTVGTLNRR